MKGERPLVSCRRITEREGRVRELALVLVKRLIECGHRVISRDVPIPERLREVGPMEMVDGLKLSY